MSPFRGKRTSSENLAGSRLISGHSILCAWFCAGWVLLPNHSYTINLCPDMALFTPDVAVASTSGPLTKPKSGLHMRPDMTGTCASSPSSEPCYGGLT